MNTQRLGRVAGAGFYVDTSVSDFDQNMEPMTEQKSSPLVSRVPRSQLSEDDSKCFLRQDTEYLTEEEEEEEDGYETEVAEDENASDDERINVRVLAQTMKIYNKAQKKNLELAKKKITKKPNINRKVLSYKVQAASAKQAMKELMEENIRLQKALRNEKASSAFFRRFISQNF